MGEEDIANIFFKKDDKAVNELFDALRETKYYEKFNERQIHDFIDNRLVGEILSRNIPKNRAALLFKRAEDIYLAVTKNLYPDSLDVEMKDKFVKRIAAAFAKCQKDYIGR